MELKGLQRSGKAEALLGLRTRKTSFTLAFDLEPADLIVKEQSSLDSP